MRGEIKELSMIEENSIYLQSLLQMQQAYEKGATVLMMIDS